MSASSRRASERAHYVNSIRADDEARRRGAPAQALNNYVPPPRFEYTNRFHCPGADPNGANPGCAGAGLVCGQMGPGVGMAVDVFARELNNSTAEWINLGTTCPGGAAPPPTTAAGLALTRMPPPPVLTYAMVVNAFHNTPFAKASVAIQPVGGATLVNLPTYFQATWQTAGYGPGEVEAVNPATMAGFDVRIKPGVTTFTYHFGDGASQTTESMGGPYPTGDVRHTFTKPATVAPSVTATYTADYSVNGGPWIPITGSVPIAGPAASLQVRTATNELIHGS